MEVAPALPLRDAVLKWCSQPLVSDVQVAECRLTYAEHNHLGLILLSEREALRQPDRFDHASSGDYNALRTAWDCVLQDLRRRIESNALFVDGVRLAPERGTLPEEISNHWAADMSFDVMRNTISLGRDRFGAIRVSTTRIPLRSDRAGMEISAGAHPDSEPSTEAAASSAYPGRPFKLTKAGLYDLAPEDVVRLSDDTLLALLEEHARRVIGTPDAKLISPGKVSFLPIILRKMIHRAERGELLPRLADEGEYLAQWIASKVEHHHLPAAGTITRTLGRNYAVLKARSTAATQ
ncbi:hypothetical protein [Sediminicoccus rosea]|uniref:Uncharacterized protein n=1 Tax=Sediminicoccus rosea TaxID=1225128 RepID=A0ABZ0PDT6_9PROT|nr:hypothetical protein [Sediminicoccus rosea]WPB83746.1 hypothetical protein R9Z33_16715 [Sediminicoccus rosea]